MLPSGAPFLIAAEQQEQPDTYARAQCAGFCLHSLRDGCGLLAPGHWQFATGRSLPGQNKDERNQALQDCDVA